MSKRTIEGVFCDQAGCEAYRSYGCVACGRDYCREHIALYDFISAYPDNPSHVVVGAQRESFPKRVMLCIACASRSSFI